MDYSEISFHSQPVSVDPLNIINMVPDIHRFPTDDEYVQNLNILHYDHFRNN